ncbi:pectinesterase inhibitor 7-like [Cornus florida]|uniref:pectinesterase inhibitor 7-like n=1 Tax=Cornus florida TaxID=4283 RepID=UPI00289E600B|nr:pectinesterase inhibitor 7-like [Cornus florida]
MEKLGSFSLLCFLCLAILLHVQRISAVESPNSEPNNTTDFIRTKCNATSYPELCYTSLSGFANAIKEDPARLAKVAIAVSLSKVKHMANYVANISRQADKGGNKRLAEAVDVCFEVFGGAVEGIRDSLSQMKRLHRPGQSQSLGFQISNVQTWMTGALTCQDTCTDALEEIDYGGPVKTDICDRVVEVYDVTSNALSLVNSYADTVAAR